MTLETGSVSSVTLNCRPKTAIELGIANVVSICEVKASSNCSCNGYVPVGGFSNKHGRARAGVRVFDDWQGL